MNKAKFLEVLASRLSQLPPEEIERSLAYYAEMIDDRIEDGMTEAQAVASLEDLDTIVDRILQDTPITTLVRTKMRPKGGWSAASIVLAILGFPIWLPLLVTVFAVVLTLYVVLWSLLIAFIAVAAALTAAGVGCIIGAFFGFGNAFLPMLGAGLLLLGLGLLALLGVKSAIVSTARMSASLGRGIKSLFIRKER